jgi:cytochrome c553
MNKHLLTTTLCLGLIAGSAHAAGDAAAGQAKAAACAACHGADGNSVNPEWPKLAGQNVKYFKKQLLDFKEGRRKNAIMAGMVAPLSAEDTLDLGAYFAAQTGTGGFASEAAARLGEQIYRAGNAKTGVPACTACHGPRGAGDPLAGTPALSGQHAKYTAMQLQAFRDAERNNDSQSMMRDAARWLTKEEIAAVAEYIAGLH